MCGSTINSFLRRMSHRIAMTADIEPLLMIEAEKRTAEQTRKLQYVLPDSIRFHLPRSICGNSATP